jgi:hypothetical protein
MKNKSIIFLALLGALFLTPIAQAALPGVATLVATNITATTATLQGSVNPSGAASGAWFAYGLTPDLAIVGIIPNPSFESDTFTTFPGYARDNGGVIAGWVLSDPASVGLNPAGESPFADNGAIPEGANVAFIQSMDNSLNTLSTILTNLTPNGIYELSFRANCRSGYGTPNPTWQLSVQAATSFTTSPAVGGNNGYYTNFGIFTASLGTTANLLLGNQTAEDSTILLDAFSINQATGGINLGNGSANLIATNQLTGLTPATTYYYRLEATNSSGRTLGTILSFTTAVAVPSVVTQPATSVNPTNAILNGVVGPNGAATQVWFNYGTTTNYGSMTATAILPASTATFSVSNLVLGLTPGKVYHYRVVAANNAVTNFGSDLTFFSLLAAPQVALPTLALIGSARMTNECHSPYSEQGVGATSALTAGSAHTLTLQVDGTIAAWGDNTSGQLNIPAGLKNVVALAAGQLHSLALRSDGTIAAWGNNTYGQLNIPTGLSNVVAIAGGYFHSLALRNDGTVAAWGYNVDGETTIPAGLSNVVAIAGGRYYSLALRSDGTVIAWGDNTLKLTIPAGLSNVVAIAGGAFHCLALRSDGTVIAWGNNSYGQLTIPAGLSNVVAIAGGDAYSLALRSDGTMAAWGDSYFGKTTIPTSISLHCTISGSLNIDTPGIYVLSYSATNFLGASTITNTRTVVVTDTLPPVITLLGASSLTTPLNAPFIDPGATALDACGGSFAIITNSTVNAAQPGTYTVTYRSTDSYGNTATNTRTVVVATVPAISGLGALVIARNGVTGIRTVTLAALVNPNGLDTTVNFQYGLSLAYGGTNNAPALPASFSQSNETFSWDLSAGLTYHWRLVASNSLGTSISPDQTFNTDTPGGGLPGDLNGDGVVSQSELEAVYASYVTNSPWLYMTNVAGLGGTNVSFTLPNSVAGAYTVQYSTNLVNWLPLGPAIPRHLFTDTNAPTVPQRYYRLSYP